MITVFEDKLEYLINKIEKDPNTPDFTLADYLIACLEAFAVPSSCCDSKMSPLPSQLIERRGYEDS